MSEKTKDMFRMIFFVLAIMAIYTSAIIIGAKFTTNSSNNNQNYTITNNQNGE